MASISLAANGTRRILFEGRDGKRRAIYIGKMTKRDAESFRTNIEHLVSAGITGAALDNATSIWVANLNDKYHAKLAKAGLVPRRHSVKLGEFLERYIATRTDVKPKTKAAFRYSADRLIDHFGADKLIRDITSKEAKPWREWMLNDLGQAENTVRARTSKAKQFFRVAIKEGLIERNPFEDLASTIGSSESEFHFVTLEETHQILDACPSAEWRLIVALCRFGGLRCPSEPVRLKWHDVNWVKGRIMIHSPKTEHHKGHETRLIPMFPEIRTYLGDLDVPRRFVRIGQTRRHACPHQLSAIHRDYPHSVPGDLEAGRFGAMAATIPRDASDQANGADRPVSAARCLSVAWQFRGDRQQALSQCERHPFSACNREKNGHDARPFGHDA